VPVVVELSDASEGTVGEGAEGARVEVRRALEYGELGAPVGPVHARKVEAVVAAQQGALVMGKTA
jgi:hypothetical protein